MNETCNWYNQTTRNDHYVFTMIYKLSEWYHSWPYIMSQRTLTIMLMMHVCVQVFYYNSVSSRKSHKKYIIHLAGASGLLVKLLACNRKVAGSSPTRYRLFSSMNILSSIPSKMRRCSSPHPSEGM